MYTMVADGWGGVLVACTSTNYCGVPVIPVLLGHCRFATIVHARFATIVHAASVHVPRRWAWHRPC